MRAILPVRACDDREPVVAGASPDHVAPEVAGEHVMFVSGARHRQLELLDTQAGDRPSDHQLLDLAGAFEDRVAQAFGFVGCRLVLHDAL
jgi:hypothetical protein